MSGASLILTKRFDAGAGEITKRRFVEGGSTDGGEAVAFSPEGPDRLLDIPFVS